MQTLFSVLTITVYYNPSRTLHNSSISIFITNSIVNPQFGLVCDSSILQHLLVFLNNLVEALNNKAHTAWCHTGSVEAFDSIPHNELLVKLMVSWYHRSSMGMVEVLSLSICSQIVHINHQYMYSNALTVLSGVLHAYDTYMCIATSLYNNALIWYYICCLQHNTLSIYLYTSIHIGVHPV